MSAVDPNTSASARLLDADALAIANGELDDELLAEANSTVGPM